MPNLHVNQGGTNREYSSLSAAHYSAFLKNFRPLSYGFCRNRLLRLDYLQFTENEILYAPTASKGLATSVTKVIKFNHLDSDIEALYYFVYEPYSIFMFQLHADVVGFSKSHYRVGESTTINYLRSKVKYWADSSDLKRSPARNRTKLRIKLNGLRLPFLRYLRLYFNSLSSYRTRKSRIFGRKPRLRLSRIQRKVGLRMSRFNYKLSFLRLKSRKSFKLNATFRSTFFRKRRQVRRKKYPYVMNFARRGRFSFYKTETTYRLSSSFFKKVYQDGASFSLKIRQPQKSALTLGEKTLHYRIAAAAVLTSTTKLVPTPTTNPYLIQLFLTNPIIYKSTFFQLTRSSDMTKSAAGVYLHSFMKLLDPKLTEANLIPHITFNPNFKKGLIDDVISRKFHPNSAQWFYDTVIRFIEFLSGRRVLFQFYPALQNAILTEDIVRYRL